MSGMSLLPFGERLVSGRAGGAGGRASAATVSAAMWSSACAGSVITVMRSHSTDSGAIPMLRWIVGTPSSASHADPLDPGAGVRPAAVGEDVDEPGAARVGHLELVGDELDRVAGERGAAAGADPGNERQRPGAVGEQRGAVAEQGGRAAAADLAQPVGEDPGDRPERVLVAAHRPGGVDDQPDVRLLDRRRAPAG